MTQDIPYRRLLQLALAATVSFVWIPRGLAQKADADAGLSDLALPRELQMEADAAESQLQGAESSVEAARASAANARRQAIQAHAAAVLRVANPSLPSTPDTPRATLRETDAELSLPQPAPTTLEDAAVAAAERKASEALLQASKAEKAARTRSAAAAPPIVPRTAPESNYAAKLQIEKVRPSTPAEPKEPPDRLPSSVELNSTVAQARPMIERSTPVRPIQLQASTLPHLQGTSKNSNEDRAIPNVATGNAAPTTLPVAQEVTATRTSHSFAGSTPKDTSFKAIEPDANGNIGMISKAPVNAEQIGEPEAAQPQVEIASTSARTVSKPSPSLKPIAMDSTSSSSEARPLPNNAPLSTPAPVDSSHKLVQFSPFVSRGTSGAKGGLGSQESSLELRGIMGDAGETRYWIFDVQRKAGAWVGLREQGFPFFISSADPDHDQVCVVTDSGRALTLRLRNSKVSVNGLTGNSAPTSLSQVPGTEVASNDEQPKPPEVDPRWKKFQEDTERRALARLQALKNASGQP